MNLRLCGYMSDNLGYVGFDTHHCQFMLSYQNLSIEDIY